MKRIVLVSFVAFVVLFSLFVGALAEEQPKIRMRMALSIPQAVPWAHTIAIWAKNVTLMSAGSIEIKLYDPGKLVPAFEVHDAVSKGRIEAGHSGGAYIGGKVPAAVLFSTGQFGFTGLELMGWLYEGEGRKLLQELYDASGYNVKAFPLMVGGMETFGWFGKEINSVADLKGLRMRMGGLGAKVVAKLGVNANQLPIGEALPALQKGAIDAAELSTPILDSVFKAWKLVKYNYYPGWHTTSSFMELLINKDIWNKMSESQQKIIEDSTLANNIRSLLYTEVQSVGVMKKNVAEHGVKMIKTPPEVMKAMQKAWKEVAAEEAAKDSWFKKIYESQRKFMKDYEFWHDHTTRLMPPRVFD